MGGNLQSVVPEGEREEEIARARELPKIMVDLEAVITIEMIATGGHPERRLHVRGRL